MSAAHSAERRKLKLIKLSLENVIAEFTRLTGADSEQVTQELSLIENAFHLINGLLDERKCTSGDISRAEYAAAAYAFYDYICKENAKNKVICTLTGKASADTSYRSRIESAASLKASALETIKPVTKGCDFIFKAMEG